MSERGINGWAKVIVAGLLGFVMTAALWIGKDFKEHVQTSLKALEGADRLQTESIAALAVQVGKVEERLGHQVTQLQEIKEVIKRR